MVEAELCYWPSAAQKLNKYFISTDIENIRMRFIKKPGMSMCSSTSILEWENFFLQCVSRVGGKRACFTKDTLSHSVHIDF